MLFNTPQPKTYFQLFSLILIFLFLFGCTSQDILLVRQSIGADINGFFDGNYNGAIPFVDVNRIVFDKDFNFYENIFYAPVLSGDLNWVYLSNYPDACPSGTAVQSIGDTLGCVALSDTNGFVTWLDANATFATITSLQDLNSYVYSWGDFNTDLNYLKVGDNISDLNNDVGYITSYTDTNLETFGVFLTDNNSLYNLGDVNATNFYQGTYKVCDESGNCAVVESQDLNNVMSIGNFTEYDLNILSGKKLVFTDSNGYTTTFYRNAGNISYIKSEVEVPAIASNALGFDGTSGRSAKVIDNDMVAFGTGNYTVSAWVKTTATDTTLMTIYGAYTGAGIYAFYKASDDTWYTGWVGSGGQNISGAVHSINDGNWHFVVSRRTAVDTIELWVDNNLIATKTGITSTTSTQPTDFEIGSLTSVAGREWDGDIDEVAIWGRMLSDDDISDLYNSGAGLYLDIANSFPTSGTPVSTNLVCLYHLDEGTGTSVADSSGNGYDGSLNNSPSWVNPGFFAETNTVQEVSVLTVENGGGSGEKGIITLGNNTASTKLQGGNIGFDIGIMTRWNVDEVGDLVSENNSNLMIRSDASKLYLGAGDDASISYNGTDLIINPQEVGGGLTYFKGDIVLKDTDNSTSLYFANSLGDQRVRFNLYSNNEFYWDNLDGGYNIRTGTGYTTRLSITNDGRIATGGNTTSTSSTNITLGGNGNTTGGGNSYWSGVFAGLSNINEGRASAIIGGQGNKIDYVSSGPHYDVILGGTYNQIQNDKSYSTILNGAYNEANGSWNILGGRRVKSDYSGVFAVADNTDADFVVSQDSEFATRFDLHRFTTNGTDNILTIDENKVLISKDLNVGGNTYFDGNIYYNDTFFNDVRSPIIDVASSQQAPDYDETYMAYYFHNDVLVLQDYVFVELQMPHDYKEGTNIGCHLHWSPETTDTGDVNFSISYSWTNYGDVFTGTPTYTSNIQAGSGVAQEHQILSFGDINGVGKKISSIFKAKIERESASATDTFADNAYAHFFDCHYEIDSPGSRDEYTK